MSQQKGKKSRINVEIYGQQYSVVGDESTSHIRMVAAIVDDKMRELNAKNPSLDTSRLAVLTAVNVIHDYIKLKEEHEKLKESMTKKEWNNMIDIIIILLLVMGFFPRLTQRVHLATCKVNKLYYRIPCCILVL